MNKLIETMDDNVLRYNLLLTQGIILGLGIAGSLFIHDWPSFLRLFRFTGWIYTGYAIFFALAVFTFSVILERIFPADWLDEGEINKRLFRNLSVAKTACLCLLVGVAEELLFRGFVQFWLGNVWTSTIFTFIHIRYLRKPILLVLVFATSFGLGYLFDMQGSLLVPIFAHSLLDFLSALIIRKRR